MSLGSKLRIDSMGIFLTLVFYIITGIVSIGVLPLANYPPHVGIVAILSLITAYGLFRKRSWALYPVAMLFLIVTILALYMIYYLFLADLLIGIGMIAYLILTWIATAYTANRRTKLES
jgi:hypothetical protein